MEKAGAASIVESFVDNLDEVVERCMRAIWDGLPSYARAGDPFRDEVRRAVRENVGTLARVLREGREIARHELDDIERTGARRAEASIPLDDVLAAYRTVSRVCWDALAEGCRVYPGDAVEVTITLAKAVLRYTDHISAAVAEAYARKQRALVRDQEGARREFLADLLYGNDAPAEDIFRRARSFGYDLSLEYIALVGVGPADGAAESEVASAAAVVAGDLGSDPIVVQRGEQTVALVPLDSGTDSSAVPEKLVAEFGPGWRFGMGGPQPGLEGIRRAYLEAREALEIGTALDSPGAVYRFDDLLMYHFLRVEPAVVDRFVDQTLGPLIAYDRRRKGELVKTVEAYFMSDGSVKLAGQRLFAHPHTVSYRLKQIERLTGWSLRDPEDKLRLQVALRALRLSRSRRES